MDSAKKHPRAAMILAPGEGRSYSMGHLPGIVEWFAANPPTDAGNN
jgi:hypothetical protein